MVPVPPSAETSSNFEALKMEVSACPFCNLRLPAIELQRHANDHFPDENPVDDFEYARQVALSVAEDEPESSSSMYYTPDAMRAMNKHDSDGKLSSLVRSQKKEIFQKIEGGLMTLLRKCLELESHNWISVLSRPVDHFQSSWDVGWGCGWRNIQMLSSHLLSERQDARGVLYGGSGFVPDIGSLQRWLELAWAKGFDTNGSDHFDRSIYGKKSWIGATECAALFRSFGLRARIVDFCSKREATRVYGPMDMLLSRGKLDFARGYPSVSSEKKGHQVLAEWLWNYFSGDNISTKSGNQVILSQKGPLYFQHDGHSRTIVGIQARRQTNGMQEYNLLIFDPSSKTRDLEKSLRQNAGWQSVIKRGVHTLKKPEYQVVTVACNIVVFIVVNIVSVFQLCFIDPGIARGKELEELKTLHSIRVEL